MPGIDIHTHAFHPKIAPKVLVQLESHYGISPVGTGLIEDLLDRATSAGLDTVVVHNAATAPAQVIPANNWALSLKREHQGVRVFGSLHPDDPNWERELERLRANNILGIKFHPEFQGFRLDDGKLLPLIEAAQDDFLFMVHVGDALPPRENASCPYKVARLMSLFPKARIIAAHMGGYLHWRYALDSIIGRDVYIDTSSSLAFLDDDTLRAIFRKHAPERILFGSDYPLFDPKAEMEVLDRRLRLGDAGLERVVNNARVLVDQKPE